MPDWQHDEYDGPTGTQPLVFRSVALGVMVTVALHLGAGVVMGMLAYAGSEGRQVLGPAVADWLFQISLGWALGFGVVQVLYILPAFGAAIVTRRQALAAGIVIGAGLTFTLQGACYGLFCGSMFLNSM